MRSDAKRTDNGGFRMRLGGINGRENSNSNGFERMRSSAVQSRH